MRVPPFFDTFQGYHPAFWRAPDLRQFPRLQSGLFDGAGLVEVLDELQPCLVVESAERRVRVGTPGFPGFDAKDPLQTFSHYYLHMYERDIRNPRCSLCNFSHLLAFPLPSRSAIFMSPKPFFLSPIFLYATPLWKYASFSRVFSSITLS